MLYFLNSKNDIVAKSYQVNPNKEELVHIHSNQYSTVNFQYVSATELNEFLTVVDTREHCTIGEFLVLELQDVKQLSNGLIAQTVRLEKK